jgi:hypothetical protein
MDKEFIPWNEALALKELGFDEPCFGYFYTEDKFFETKIKNSELEEDCSISAPLYQQAINFLYICSNKQIDIQLKGSDTHEERIRKIEQGCKDLWNLQNNKSK